MWPLPADVALLILLLVKSILAQWTETPAVDPKGPICTVCPDGKEVPILLPTDWDVKKLKVVDGVVVSNEIPVIAPVELIPPVPVVLPIEAPVIDPVAWILLVDDIKPNDKEVVVIVPVLFKPIDVNP